MADYHSRLAEAIRRLRKNNVAARRKLYSRIRRDIEYRFRGLNLVREQLDLERAIFKTEDTMRKFEVRSKLEIDYDELVEDRRLHDLELSNIRLRIARLSEDPGRSREKELARQEKKTEKQLAAELRLRRDERQKIEKSPRRKKKEAKLVESRLRREAREEEAKQRARALMSIVSHVQLADAASPSPSITADGRLDAGPNSLYDAPTVDDDLPTLPLRQRALIRSIRSDLPGNAPKILDHVLDSYDDELRARGVQPILGLLKDMAAIIDASFSDTDAHEWAHSGLREALKRFAENHALFVKHFPLDPKREELYARTAVDENSAVGPTLSYPFEAVARASVDANRAGLTTDDFVKILDKMAEFAKIVSTQPPVHSPQPPPAPPFRDGDYPSGAKAPMPTISAGDRIAPTVTSKKRILLSGFGFFERAYNLLGTSAQLSSPAEGNVLLTAIHDAIASLSKLIS
jgi:hypothetical protein